MPLLSNKDFWFHVLTRLHPVGTALAMNNMMVPTGITVSVPDILEEIAVAMAENSASTSLPFITLAASPLTRLSFVLKSVIGE